MNVKRIFHPIGQGAFYTEKHNDSLSELSIVYDCGGSNVQIVKDAITHSFDKEESVDAVFISHFHNDHINGLEHLLEYCNVKKVILPVLSNSLKILYVVQNSMNNDDADGFSSRLILSPEEELKGRYCGVQVVDEAVDENSEEIPLSNLPSSIASGSKLSGGVNGWIYLPFHIADQTIADELLDGLKSKGIDLDDIVGELMKKKATISAVYKNVIGDNKNTGRNANSLCVYSGPKDRTVEYDSLTFQSKECITQNLAGCLYMGDFEAKNPENLRMLESVYSNYRDLISTVQIPHHGSKENFSRELVSNKRIAIISADPSGRYEHPSAEVIKLILVSESKPILVTKEASTIVVQLIGSSVCKYLYLSPLTKCKLFANTFPEWCI